MRISSKGLSFIAGWESFRSAPYYDEAGFPTIGYGHLLSHIKEEALTNWPPISQQSATDLLQSDTLYFEKMLSNDIGQTPRVIPTTQEEFDALTSLLFNIGWGWWVTSTIRRMHFNCAGQEQIASAFGLFNKELGSDHIWISSPGLTRRRKAEADVYIFGLYRDANGTIL